jgi:nuclear GTP-binding protein
VVGYPNCGKSSVINALLSAANKKTRTKTGNAAGVTTQHQQIVLDKKLTLIDSPGVVFASEGGEVETQASLVIRKAVNVASIDDPVAVTEAVVRRISKQQVALQFRLAEFETVDEFLNTLGKAKCKFKRGGVVDKEAAARFALHAWADGKAKFFTMPEVKTRHNQAVLVAEAKPDFNLDELFKEADAAFQNTTEHTHGNFMHVGM